MFPLDRVTEVIRKHSNLDHHRPYLGMSGIGQCPLRIYRNFIGGVNFDDAAHRKSYQGYMYETHIKTILAEAELFRPASEREIVAAFDSRFCGHTDGSDLYGDLVEIKSMNRTKYEKVQTSGRLLYDHYWQVQCYMQYGGYRKANVWIVNTETFELQRIIVNGDRKVWQAIDEKAKGILQSIDTEVEPACTCNHCQPASVSLQ